MKDAGSITGFLLTAAAVFLVFLPIIIAESRSRKVLVAASILLSLAGILTLSGGAIGGTLTGLGLAIAFPVAAACWFGGLFCGLACFLDSAAQRRSEELTFRLIHGDAAKLPVPKGLR